MIKNKFAIIIDCLCLSFITFIINFCWLNKFLKSNIFSLLISIFFFFIFFLILLIVFFNKNNLQINNHKEQITFKKCKEILTYNDEKSNIELLEKITSTKYFKDNLYLNDNAYFYIKTVGSLNSYDFFIANNFYKSSRQLLPLIFICNEKNEEFSAILNNSPIKYDVFLLENLFFIMKNKNIIPKDFNINNNKNKKNKVKNIKEKFKLVLKNIKFRDCFFSGISLVIISAFIPYSLYYLIVGTLLLFLAFAHIFFKANINNNDTVKKNALEELCK